MSTQNFMMRDGENAKKVHMYRKDRNTGEVIDAMLPVGRGYNAGDDTGDAYLKLGWRPYSELQVEVADKKDEPVKLGKKNG